MRADRSPPDCASLHPGYEVIVLKHSHVRDVDGKTHDIVVLGHNIAQVQAQMEAYGLPGAVQH